MPSGLRSVRRGCRFTDGLLDNLPESRLRNVYQTVHRLLAHNDLRSLQRYKNMLHRSLLSRSSLQLLRRRSGQTLHLSACIRPAFVIRYEARVRIATRKVVLCMDYEDASARYGPEP